MINGFSICNNVSGLYRSSDNIENFKFNVKFKEVNKIIPLPNFESFSLQDGGSEKDFNHYYEEKNLSWQEKILSSREIYIYKDVENCKTDSTKKYHLVIEEKDLNSTIQCPKLFTYIQNDNFIYNKRLTTQIENSDCLKKNLEKLSGYGEEENGDTRIIKDTKQDAKRSDVSIAKDNIVRMFIMVDFNNSESDPSFLLKREHVLIEITWNPKESLLTVSPDFNDFFANPYVLETNYYSRQVFHYSIEQIIQEMPDDAKLAELQLLEKHDESQRSMYNSKVFKNFIIPPKNILKCLFIIDIISVNIEDYLSGIYVEYTVELPFGYITADPLKGVTQIATPNKNDKTHFGHVFELCFSYQLGISADDSELPPEPEVYFEIISCDSWGRHRTEGYCSNKLCVTQSGMIMTTLRCVRPQGPNRRLWEMQRYFVGGKHILEDLTWLGTPPLIEGDKLNKLGISTMSSGTLEMSLNVIVQSRNFIKKTENNGSGDADGTPQKTMAERLTADSLFKSVNMVLQAYKNAKNKLASSREK